MRFRKEILLIVIESPNRIEATFSEVCEELNKERNHELRQCVCLQKWNLTFINFWQKKPAEEESVVAAFAKGIPSTR